MQNRFRRSYRELREPRNARKLGYPKLSGGRSPLYFPRRCQICRRRQGFSGSAAAKARGRGLQSAIRQSA
eukprot:15480080-Alexandrium_andersonii.AAC.1